MIDHTILRPDATTSEIMVHCRLTRQYGFAGICVNLVHVATAARAMEGTAQTVRTGVGFPLRASSLRLKAC